MTSVCSLRRLSSQFWRIACGRPSITRRTVPSSPLTPASPPLLASVKRCLCVLSTRPTRVSLAPKPYSAAVSNKVTPLSRAASSTRSPCSADGGVPYAWLRFMQPRPRLLTSKGPSFLVCMAPFSRVRTTCGEWRRMASGVPVHHGRAGAHLRLAATAAETAGALQPAGGQGGVLRHGSALLVRNAEEVAHLHPAIAHAGFGE